MCRFQTFWYFRTSLETMTAVCCSQLAKSCSPLQYKAMAIGVGLLVNPQLASCSFMHACVQRFGTVRNILAWCMHGRFRTAHMLDINAQQLMIPGRDIVILTDGQTTLEQQIEHNRCVTADRTSMRNMKSTQVRNAWTSTTYRDLSVNSRNISFQDWRPQSTYE